jgi:hypothetical protein
MEKKMVRAKFQVTGVTTHNHSTKEIELSTVYDNTIPEDQRFQKATPYGSIKMNIDNPAALEQLGLGKYFYVDFSELPGS